MPNPLHYKVAFCFQKKKTDIPSSFSYLLPKLFLIYIFIINLKKNRYRLCQGIAHLKGAGSQVVPCLACGSCQSKPFWAVPGLGHELQTSQPNPTQPGPLSTACYCSSRPCQAQPAQPNAHV